MVSSSALFCCFDDRLSMDATCTRTALRTILLLLLLLLWCLSFISMADVIYRPTDLFSISCGSSTTFSTLDTRNWTPDIPFLSQTNLSVAAPSLTPSTIQGPYTHARLSHSPFSYSFPVTSGPKFIRLFFYSTLYPNFPRSQASFSVKAGPYNLLQHFNASLNADADDDPSHPDILFREYCVYVGHGEKLNITFIPTTADSYAFINGIEIVSMPPYLYYTDPHDSTEPPLYVGTMTPYLVENKFALETMYRLKAGEHTISSSEDTGMLRTWDADSKYLHTQSEESIEFTGTTKLSFINNIPNYAAPDQVFRSVRNMGRDASTNMRTNITWQLTVDSGFTYLLRLYFCELNPRVHQTGVRFYIYIHDQLATDSADVFLWTKQWAVPVVREYVVIISENTKKVNLSLKMHPHSKSIIRTAQINAIEIFKISNSEGSLAGLNPDLPTQTAVVSHKGSNKKRGASIKTVAAVTGAVFGILLLSFIIAFFLVKHKKDITVESKKEGTSHQCGSSSLPTNLCRHFSISEIIAATNNFDELFVVGVGGFGNVYKGYIDDSTPVAIKRLKPGSQQGLNEFMNEIEMLSQLRHLHLVSLIGYCYEINEMILVYDFMVRGTLRDHLYDTDNRSLPWEKRVEICIGVARGLHYLHTGVKQVIIHRDVKSTNILLDEKWVAKVSDFGLSRIGGPSGCSMSSVSVNTEVKGSIGYLDPEYYKRYLLTEKSDVYSLGVMLLEVLSGRQPLLPGEEKQRMSLVNWAKHCYEKGTPNEIVDTELKGQVAPQSLAKFVEVAFTCLLEDGTQRPSMNDVVELLEFALQLQVLADNGALKSPLNYEDRNTPKIVSHYNITRNWSTEALFSYSSD